MNLPNKLTVGRLVLTAFFVAAASIPFAWSYTTALVLFVVASVTDYFDGWIARRYNLVTNFGKLMDPLADKILMCACFVFLVAEDLIPAWCVILILSREFLVTGLRLLATSKGSVLAADTLGKQKTVWQIATAIYFLLLLASQEQAFSWMKPLFQMSLLKPTVLGYGFLGIATFFTLVSGVGYLLRNRSVLGE